MSVTQIAYRFRGLLMSPPYIIGLFCSIYETKMHWLTWPLGIVIFLLGMMLRVWAQEHLHYRLDIKKILTTTGPYSFTRNPIYVGNMFMCLGAIITSKLLWFVPLAFLYSLSLYSLVVHHEEGHLLRKYGEPYQKYMSEVPRWLPRTMSFRNLGLINKYLLTSVGAEIQCLLSLLPFILKEFISSWIEHL
jgi:protein-S-isoprenylcysteine O-methyltransferase Ste14